MTSRRKRIILPENNAATEQALFEQGIILLTNEIDENAYEKLWSELLFLEAAGSPAIEIRFDSPGGDTLYGFLMYDLIRTYKGKTTGVVIREATSIASIIFQACTVRKIVRHGWLHIHTPSTYDKLSLVELEKEETLREYLMGLRKSCTQMLDVYMEHTSATRETLRAIMDEDRHMFAAEACALGLADKII